MGGGGVWYNRTLVFFSYTKVALTQEHSIRCVTFCFLSCILKNTDQQHHNGTRIVWGEAAAESLFKSNAKPL